MKTTLTENGTAKPCAACHDVKPLEEFHVDKTKKSGRTSTCKKCACTRSRQFYPDNKPRMLDVNYRWHLKNKYGITWEEKEEIFRLQGYKCGACGSSFPKNTKHKRWAVDHDHDTGEVRGILCCNCNAALGMADNSIEIFQALIRYLKNPPAIVFKGRTEEEVMAA